MITIQQKIENLDALVNLEELWLGKNKITVLEVRFDPPSLHKPVSCLTLHFAPELGKSKEAEDPITAIESDNKVRKFGGP